MLAVGLVIAVVAHAGRLRYANGDEIDQPPRLREFERPPDESDLL
jgi:hypothetical protein